MSCHYPTTAIDLSHDKNPCHVSLLPPVISQGSFAFARIKDEICLVQISYATSPSALTTVDVKIFRHEFITIFRFVESKTLHPADICVLEYIDDRLTRYEEENDTVFLAKDLMDRLRKMTDSRLTIQARRYHAQRVRQR